MSSPINEPIALGGDLSNSAADDIELEAPYRVSVTIVGDAPMLFHRWQGDAVDAKAKAAKGSKAKKTDNVESYVWRDDNDHICLPGEYVRGSVVDKRNGAAKYQQDPRSSRKSALDLFKAGLVSLTDLAPIVKADGSKAATWDYLDRRHVVVNQAGITRVRPAFAPGWSATVELMVLLPQYIDVRLLHRTLVDAGRLVGVGDFRPTFGRYSITEFTLIP